MPQKLLLALLVAYHKLRHYFQGHPIKVVSAYPLERVLQSPNAAGRVAEWNIELKHVLHDTNKEADDIAKRASRRLPQEPGVFEERLFKPSTEGCWTEEFKAYLLQGTLPEKEEDAERVARQATAYCIQDGELYWKWPNDVPLRCISREQGCELLAHIHGGDCGHHSSSRTLVGKAFRNGFYWSMTLNDATELVRSCEACQFHAKQIHQPARGL
ncbi:uncharacterized protein [Aegilops tauschii subsp. strangulata]|uniref:uncharacterized protein n=1 Tax=Aegilops tauschii subsp. strangulata TaxID=200361 RepID=UPI000989BD51|nr:uncharacterized protein LOC109782306 [Aegilops tauschii subsp. strangulata]